MEANKNNEVYRFHEKMGFPPIPNVKRGEAIPWFNQVGEGIQFELQTGIDDLLEQGFIIEIL